MRTPSPLRAGPLRGLVAVATAALLLAACAGGGGDDDTLTDVRPAEDPPLEDAEDDAAPSDDVATEQGAGGQVPPLLDVVDDWPESTVTIDEATTFVVKVADEPGRRQQGLMHVPELPEGVGMLFLFEEASTGGFWMKNTLVPLDIAYILDDEVVAVLQMDPCEDDPCPTYDPGTEYDAALEVNQGALAEAGIGEGATVTWTDPVEVSPA